MYSKKCILNILKISNLLNGKVAQALIYNRALSQAEILQNYYAFKFRYGI